MGVSSVRRSECVVLVSDFTPSQHFPVELLVLLIDCIVTRADIQPFVSNDSRTHTPS